MVIGLGAFAAVRVSYALKLCLHAAAAAARNGKAKQSCKDKNHQKGDYMKACCLRKFFDS